MHSDASNKAVILGDVTKSTATKLLTIMTEFQ